MDKVAADLKLTSHHNQLLKLRLIGGLLLLCHVPSWHAEGQHYFPVPLLTCLNYQYV
jgi:hypothetical protein